MGIELGQVMLKNGNLDVLSSAKEALLNFLNKQHKSNIPLLLLLSGGSSLALLDVKDFLVVGSNLTIAPLDERYSTNPLVNNMAQIANTSFYKKAVENGAYTIDTRVKDGESREKLANRFNDSLLKWIQSNKNGIIIATIGIGPDGHIAGIMPYPEDPEKFNAQFDDGCDTHLVVGYDAGDKNVYSERVTTTMNLIRKIDIAIVYAVGANKKGALEKLVANEGSISATPARILREISGKVLLFTDQRL